MPRYIIHHDGWFFEWSTIVDAPVTTGMRRDEFAEHYLHQYGASRFGELDERLARAIEHGTSVEPPMSTEELVAGNRAGMDGEEIPLAQIIAAVIPSTPGDD